MMKKQDDGFILKKGKEEIFKKRHHWIFSGAIHHFPTTFSNGDIYPVYNSENQLLGYAYFNKKTSLCGRILSFGNENPKQALLRNIEQAISLRKHFFNEKRTNAYRLINGEADRVPGLIVDKYNDYLVLQLGTLGIERMKEELVEHFQKLLKPKGIYEKSQLPSRKEEGLQGVEGLLRGNIPDTVEILEEGRKFIVSIIKGQKTGFFLDQREMRSLIGSYSKDKKVLNCFAYSGGFTVAALQGGALRVDSVDISEEALALAKKSVTLNGANLSQHGFYCADVFSFLRERPLDYEIIILDPPAFAKKKQDVKAACRGYKEINRQALQKMPPQSLLLTCSCSYHIHPELFQMVIFQAAQEASRDVKIIGRHQQAVDHPINLYHPETDYLKSLLLYVD